MNLDPRFWSSIKKRLHHLEIQSHMESNKHVHPEFLQGTGSKCESDFLPFKKHPTQVYRILKVRLPALENIRRAHYTGIKGAD